MYVHRCLTVGPPTYFACNLFLLGQFVLYYSEVLAARLWSCANLWRSYVWSDYFFTLTPQLSIKIAICFACEVCLAHFYLQDMF